MNRDDIIRMAREAGMTVCRDEWVFREMLERFAALVAAAEREACAQVCEAERERLFWVHNVQEIMADEFVAAIRAMGEK